jgi:hypothetical protein
MLQAGALPLQPFLRPIVLCLFWRYGLTFCPGQPGWRASCFKLPTVTGMTGVHPQLLCIEMELHKLWLGLALSHYPPDLSVSKVAGMTGVSYPGQR